MDPGYVWGLSEMFRRAAVINEDLEDVQRLALVPSVDLNLHGKGVPAFYGACANGNVEIVRFLLDFRDGKRSVDLNFDYHGYTPLGAACHEGHEEVVKMLLADERVYLPLSSRGGRSPLMDVAEEGMLNIVKLLLASEKQPHLKHSDEFTPGATGVPNGKEIERLIAEFKKNPEKTRVELQAELGQAGTLAGNLFALIVFLSDGYLKAPDS